MRYFECVDWRRRAATSLVLLLLLLDLVSRNYLWNGASPPAPTFRPAHLAWQQQQQQQQPNNAASPHAESALGQQILRETNGECPSFDEWAPALRRFLYFYRPHSVTALDVSATVEANAVGHWVQIIRGSLFMRLHPKGFKYAERGVSMIAQVQRMLARGWPAPDTDFLFDVMDAPRFGGADAHKVRAPVGSLSADHNHIDYPLPDMGFYQWRELSAEFRTTPYSESIHTCLTVGEAKPYRERIRRVIFRGTCNSIPREQAVALTPTRPDILDMKCVGGLSLTNISEYAIAANFEGNGYSARTKWLLALGSPVLYLLGGYNRDSKVQFFYPLLVPYTHFWPVAGVGQIIPATEHLLAHPDEAERIGRAAADFVRTHLLPHHIDCVWYYYAHLLAELRAAGETVQRAPNSVDISNSTYSNMLKDYFDEKLWK